MSEMIVRFHHDERGIATSWDEVGKLVRCKDCKHRDEDECPMRYEEWVSFEEDGYIESDNIAHDQTRDDGFCDRGEEDDDKE